MVKDREAWPDAVHGVAKNWTRLSEQQQNRGIMCENPGLKDLGSIPDSFSHPVFPTATAAAKSLQLCLTLCDPVDGSPPGSTVPGILKARTLEWVPISFSNA